MANFLHIGWFGLYGIKILKLPTYISKTVLDDMKDGLKLHTASSMVSGIVYSVCSNPMDVLKTR